MKPEDITSPIELLCFLEINPQATNKKIVSDILDTALIHPSYANEHSINYDNQRLEFLGDAILNAAITIKLLDLFPRKQEGELTAIRSYLVDAKMCYKMAKKINLDKYIKIGNGLKGSIPNSVLADGIEAIIGAAYLINVETAHNPYAKTTAMIYKIWTDELFKCETAYNYLSNNYKGKLQEYCQKNGLVLQYHLAEKNADYTTENGSQNNFHIVAQVYDQDDSGRIYYEGNGYGHNKQSAEMNAANAILIQITMEKSE